MLINLFELLKTFQDNKKDTPDNVVLCKKENLLYNTNILLI